jgi:predicted Zn-dependent protease
LAADDPSLPQHWEVEVFAEPSANAFALPGGKIGVHTGMLEVARTPDQLATVLAHEVAHVAAQHSNERLSRSSLAELGLGVAELMVGADTPARQQLMALLGLGTQVGVLLPFDRAQESEADLLGLQMMARAGFDPRGSVELWRAMEEAGGGAPPEFLSTHPSSATRIQQLQRAMPQALALYQRARERGRDPDCRP